MNREIKQDYERLVYYFVNYDLKKVSNNPSFLNNIKCIHRKLYSYQIFICEAEQNNFFSSSLLLNYYAEVGSDLILSLFCWANGAYKPAKFQLRSAIENFIKAALLTEKGDIILCKNVFEIMNLASNSSFFDNSICKERLEKLKNEYSNLCAFVHSSPEALFSQNALIQLPEYNKTLANEFTKNFQTIVNCSLCLIYYNYYSFIYSIHSTNRDLFLQGLTPSDKAIVYKEKIKDTTF